MLEILEDYIEAIEILQPADGYIIVGPDLTYRSMSKNALDLMGDPDILGKNLKNTKSSLAAKATVYEKLSKEIIQSSKIHFKLITKVYINKELFFYNSRISKILNKEGQLIGIATFYNKLSPSIGLSRLFTITDDFAYIYYIEEDDLPQTKDGFSIREKCIIWLIALGMARKEVATTISKIEGKEINSNTITTIINRGIYNKLNVNNTSEFIKKAIRLNLLDSIPLILFEFFSQISKE